MCVDWRLWEGGRPGLLQTKYVQFSLHHEQSLLEVDFGIPHARQGACARGARCCKSSQDCFTT